METKFFIYLFLLLGMFGGIYAVFINQDTDMLNQKLILARQSATNIQGTIARTSQQIEQRKEVAALVQTTESRKSEKEALEKEIHAIQAAEPALAEAMNQAIIQVRRESVGMSFPELTLTGGVVLKNAQIQRVDEQEVVFKHSDGVKRARLADLPADLKDRLRLGALAALSTTAPAAAESSTPVTSAAMAKYEEERKKYEKKLLDAQLATERMTKDLTNLKTQLAQAESDLSAATSATKKFYSKTRRDQISLQVQAMQNRVDIASIELRRLEASAPAAPAQ